MADGFQEFPAEFRDSRGVDNGTFATDGRRFRVTVRGHTLTGRTLDTLVPSNGRQAGPTTLPFDFDGLGYLEIGELVSSIPVTIVRDGKAESATVGIWFVAGIDAVHQDPGTSVTLEIDGQTYRGTGAHLELGFGQLESQLPEGIELRCCFTCGLSGYNFAGDGLSGMLCFRDRKEQYLQVRSKRAYMSLQPQATEFVQEFYLCREWIPRRPGIGYR